jgi:hypothetical protein
MYASQRIARPKMQEAYLPPLQSVFGTAALPGWVLTLLVPMPVLVWGLDEVYRALRRNAGGRH